MTTTIAGARDGRVTRSVVGTTAAAGAAALAVGALLAWLQARFTGDDEYLTSDLVALAVFAAMGLLVVGLLDIWALRGGEARIRRVVGGMAIAMVLVLPLVWWNALPVMMSTSVLLLCAHLPTERTPRIARLSAVFVLAVVLAVWIGSTAASVL